MKTLYKNCPWLLILFFAVSCSQELTYNEAISKNKARLDDPREIADADFLVEVKSVNILETSLTQLASDTAYASAVVELARQALADHLVMSEDLQKLANKEKIKLPDLMSNEHQSIYNRVLANDREDFDQGFIEALKRVNEDINKDFMNMATEAYDPDIRAFAARKLDMVRVHSEKINEVESKLLSTY